MTPDAGTVLIARSHPNVLALLMLGAFSIVLAYTGLMAFDTSVRMIGPYRLGRPSPDFAVFLLFLAAVMFAVAVWQTRRLLVPNIDVVADAEGITSQQTFWGRAALPGARSPGSNPSIPACFTFAAFHQWVTQTAGDRHPANRRAGC